MFPATSQVKLLIDELNIISSAVLPTKYAEARKLLYFGGGVRGGRGGRGGKVLCCMMGVCWLLGRKWFLSSNS